MNPMKKSLYAFAALSLAAVTAYAAPKLDDSLPDLNAAVKDMLAQFQTDASRAALEFTSIVSDDANVLQVKLNGFYQRVGKVQTMDVRVDNVSFDDANGNPVAHVNGSMGFDLTQVFQQDQINGLVDAAEGMVEDIAKNYTRPYGEAASVKGTMLKKVKDADGNYTAFQASIVLKIDLSKLPADKKVEDMPLVAAVVFFDVNLSKGIKLDSAVILNPAFKNFHGQGTTLKMALEKLLTRDDATQKKITDIFSKVDKMAAGLVDAKVK